jgi:UDP:flavonoid glycosyltransferase YjiC (YdhE family)
VRALLTFAGGIGHAAPLVPVARALAAAGHAVAFSGRARVADELRAQGFAVFADPPHDDGSPPEGIAPLLEPSAEREDRVLREGFAGDGARRRAAIVLALCAEWAPDVVVCDELDFGGMIAAERAGVPHACVLVTAAGSFVRPAVVSAALDVVRREHGLAPDPGVTMPSRHLVLAPCPPSFRDPAFPLPATAHGLRPATFERTAGPPTLLFTLGTVFNRESGDLFDRVLAGLRDLPVDVIATVGRNLDPGRFGTQPAHVRVERHVPLRDVLPRCDLVVGHGGSGTVLAALAAGIPSVVLPIGADQPHNAARLEAVGAGVALDALRATPGAIGEAVLHVLREPGYRVAAQRMRDEIMALPEPAQAVTPLERLAGRR